MAGKILVVDDDDAVLWTLGAVLTDAGHSVTLCPTGADALGKIPTTQFDVVLTDLKLGDNDGLHILQTVRGTWPDTVTLMLTGYASVESAIGALRAGAYDYLRKPCSPEELLATVERALERRRLTLQVKAQMRSLETAIDTARELHSALSARLEGTTALLREREHVLFTVCSELRSSLIAIAGVVNLVVASGQRDDLDALKNFEQIRQEAQSLAERVNVALQITRSESVDAAYLAPTVPLAPITLDLAPVQ